jgi:hypothetical protein
VHRLCFSHDHRPIVSTSATSAGDPVQEIGPGKQMVGLLLPSASDLPTEFASENGFLLAAFLAARTGPVCFLGEGDARLAQYCAEHKQSLLAEIPVATNVDRGMKVTKKQRLLSTCFEDTYKMIRQSEEYGCLDANDCAFVTTVFLADSELVPAYKCTVCDRRGSPEDWRFCCRTCKWFSEQNSECGVRADEGSNLKLHGNVCNRRFQFLGGYSRKPDARDVRM